ncbi:MFS transporter [Paenibacillus sp. P26]|nr:MFS transporter [Paenibacillus sp. P26]
MGKNTVQGQVRPQERMRSTMGWLRLRERWEARTLSIPVERRLSKEAGAALFIHFCFQFGASMSGVFLTLYLWRLTHSLWINGLYNAVNYAVAPLAFALGGYIIKKKDRMVTYRIGIGLIALFYLAVVLAGERVVDYYVLFAVFNGISSAFYWAGYLTLMYDVSTEQNRIRFLAVNMIFFTLAGLIGPALAGLIIRMNDGLKGYTIVFGIAFFMFLLAALGSLRIKGKTSHHKTYYLKYVGIVMKKNRDWLKALFGFTTMGLFQGIMLFLPNILLFQLVGREDLVGYLGVLLRQPQHRYGHVYVPVRTRGESAKLHDDVNRRLSDRNPLYYLENDALYRDRLYDPVFHLQSAAGQYLDLLLLPADRVACR